MSEFDEYAGYADEFGDEKSKSQVKRELQELKDLGRTLVELTSRDLNKLNLDEDLHEAVVAAQSMSKGALKRQIGFIGGLIANMDYASIQQDLENLRQPHQGQVKQFHQLEQWRDQLLAGDTNTLNELIAEFAEFDIQYVRQLIRNASREQQQNKPPKSARLLFQYLQQCQRDQ